jgi:hypothetical protein
VAYDAVRAEVFEPSKKAVLPCGCTGLMLGHSDECVQFGIERAVCRVHREDEMASVGKNELLTPTEPFSPFGG